ncbi:MAG: ligand-binding SRPBCC domain-containing protein [Pirellulaceae bacterium]|jgi:ligand-binding SRPBCC domain-containing protein
MTSVDVLKIEPLAADLGTYQLTSEQRFERPREDVFPFFADAGQLQTITPPWLHFAIESALPIEMRMGALIDYRLRLRGIPIRWRTEISAWEPPFRFVDKQLRGPYSYWHHEHFFEEDGGGTLVRDVVQYRPRGGRVIHALFVKGELLKIFRYRQQVLSEYFGAVSELSPEC